MNNTYSSKRTNTGIALKISTYTRLIDRIDFFELKLGRVIISPTIAARTKLTIEIQIVVQRPPMRNSILEDPWG